MAAHALGYRRGNRAGHPRPHSSRHGLTAAVTASQQPPVTPPPPTQTTRQSPLNEADTPSSPANPPSTPTRTQPPGAAPLRLLYPGADADVAILALTPSPEDLASGEVEPPDTNDGYWLTNYGKPGTGSTDTTYIVGHRWVAEDAPFNRIGTNAKPGDGLTLSTQAGTLDYTVTAVETYDKATLNSAPIWNRIPGRVVLVTCDLDNPWGKNTAITADPARKKP
ncbi:class F sortase [Arthrobacter sp. PsM3]|uniref:class F sortase n=1 Tax=Arthrobacter sp. PsM3 TaxID=3030531 RepID=UPI003460E7FB